MQNEYIAFQCESFQYTGFKECLYSPRIGMIVWGSIPMRISESLKNPSWDFFGINLFCQEHTIYMYLYVTAGCLKIFLKIIYFWTWNWVWKFFCHPQLLGGVFIHWKLCVCSKKSMMLTMVDTFQLLSVVKSVLGTPLFCLPFCPETPMIFFAIYIFIMKSHSERSGF